MAKQYKSPATFPHNMDTPSKINLIKTFAEEIVNEDELKTLLEKPGRICASRIAR